jgi:hypothetical protein
MIMGDRSFNSIGHLLAAPSPPSPQRRLRRANHGRCCAAVLKRCLWTTQSAMREPITGKTWNTGQAIAHAHSLLC